MIPVVTHNQAYGYYDHCPL